MPAPFISVADLSDFIGRDLSADPGAIVAVDSACEMCRAVSGQQFNRGTSTTLLDGSGTDMVLLKQLPVNAVSSVSVAGAAVTDYRVDTARGALLRGATGSWPTPVWPYGRDNVQVVYDHGFDVADLPRSVSMVALSIAARLVIQGPAAQEGIGNVSIRYALASTDLTVGERLILGRYPAAVAA